MKYYLHDVYDELYGTSAREKGTLAHLNNFFNHRNVTTNVKQSFNHSDEFLTFCGDGYVTLSACHFLGISEIGQIPEDFPTDKTEMMTLIDSIASKILDMVFLSCQHIVRNILEEGDGVDDDEDEDDDNYPYCVCRKEIPSEPMIFCENRNCPRGKWFHLDCVNMSEDDIPDEKWYFCETCVKGAGKRVKRTGRKTVAQCLVDQKQNYALLTMWRSLNQKVRKDAIRENDGERMTLHWKFDMLQFAAHHHPKYFLFGQRLLAAMNGSVCHRLRHTLMWNRTVNPNGGAGKNIAMDLQMEFYNKKFKESVKDAAGHLTEATIARHSQMIGVGDVVRDVYKKQVSGLTGSNIHTQSLMNRDNDIAEFVTLLHDEELFITKPGRRSASFPDIDMNIYRAVNSNNIRKRLIKHTKQMAKRQQIIILRQNVYQ